MLTPLNIHLVQVSVQIFSRVHTMLNKRGLSLQRAVQSMLFWEWGGGSLSLESSKVEAGLPLSTHLQEGKKRRKKKRARLPTTDETAWKLFISTPVLHFKKASLSQFVPNQQSRTRRGKLQFFSPDLKVGETENGKIGRLIHVVLLLQAGLLVIKKIRAEEFPRLSSLGFNGKQGSKHSESLGAGLSVGQTNRLPLWDKEAERQPMFDCRMF